MRQSPRPIDLMIVGAQKAGTTSLLKYLGGHFGVCIQNRREFLFFLLNEEYEKGYLWAVEKYFAQFVDNKKLLFAKSAGLMYSPEAVNRFKNHNPDIHIIALLRNPVDRAYSAYWYARREGWETLKSFEDALDTEPERLKEDSFKWRHCAYLDRSLYYKHIQPLYEIFKKKQVHIFLYEDFKKDPLSICKQVLSIFNIEMKNFNIPSIKFNQSAISRSQCLIRLINKNNIVKRIVKKVVPGNITYGIGNKFKKLNLREFEYPPMNPETRKRLIEFFKEPNDKLGMLIGMNLKEWKTK